MTVAARVEIPTGSAVPRLAPPIPLKTIEREWATAAKGDGISPYPWQHTAAKYLMARDGKRFLNREVCIVAARRNGKTELLVPRIRWGLANGRKIIHTAHNRGLVIRNIFLKVAQLTDPADLERPIRYANGQEEIRTRNGGSYTIIAPQRGARGLGGDDLIIDELREFEDFDFMGAAAPMLGDSADPQIVYLSNAGDDNSMVLNQLRDAGSGDHVVYLEWSADPDYADDDIRGWAQANPRLGHHPPMYDFLRHEYEHRPSEVFETEHLCRWVASMTPALVTDIAWRSCHAPITDLPLRPALGVALDPAGHRASAALAWQQADGLIAYQSLLEVDDLVDIDSLGEELRRVTLQRHIRQTGYSGASDKPLSRYLPHAKAIDGREHAQASSTFATLVEGRKIRWQEAGSLSEDLRYTVRRQHADGVWSAARSQDDRPITSALAAIRAVWLAAAPRQVPRIG